MTIEETFASALKNHQEDNLEAAQNLYEKILKTNPDHFGSIFYLGALFAKVNNFQEAKKLFKKATEIQPKFSPAYTILGLFFKN